MEFTTVQGRQLFYQEKGAGVPILLIHPAGGSASTWGAVADDLAHIGRVIAYDRRGYGQTGGKPIHSIPEHTADAAGLLDAVGTTPAVVVGLSVGATIALDLALRRPEMVQAVVAYESPWRSRRHPNVSAAKTLATMWWMAQRGRHADAAERFLRWAYTYPEGESAWDAFPEEWRNIARQNANAVLADVWIAIGDYLSPKELARIDRPVVCAYGTRSTARMGLIARSLASAIPTAQVREVEGAGHAIAFDAPTRLVQLAVEQIPAELVPGDTGEPVSVLR